VFHIVTEPGEVWMVVEYNFKLMYWSHFRTIRYDRVWLFFDGSFYVVIELFHDEGMFSAVSKVYSKENRLFPGTSTGWELTHLNASQKPCELPM